MRGELQIIKSRFDDYQDTFMRQNDVDKEMMCKWIGLLIKFIDTQDDRIQTLESKMSDVFPDLS